VGFTRLSAGLGARRLIRMVNDVFVRVDAVADWLGGFWRVRPRILTV
jgi:hypothetical protein